MVSGSTGSGKSRLLQALSEQGGQVLDLEGLAAHRGSLLGALPGQAQPNQKCFESEIWSRLKQFNPAQPIFVESESKKIGALRVPDALMVRMRESPCLRLEVPQQARIALLTEEYTHFLQTPALLQVQLGHLAKLRGHETIARWQSLIQTQNWQELVGDLLNTHYDPAYFKSLARNYAPSPSDQTLHTEDLSASGLQHLARAILA